ncbi:MAG: MBL fold metallo-hydrolase [Desulfobacterales bacterium]|jgi:glyoxylase-like metal-dependent hydrolase (beta-lactamase superfamily II)
MFDFEKGKIRFIRGGKYPQSNSVLIDDNIRAVIDPACSEEKLLTIHRERPIEVVINSHGHEDHILYNWLFPDAQLWMHKLDAGVFKDMDIFIHQFFPPEEMDKKTLATWTQFLTEVVKYQPKEPDRLLEDEEILDFGQTRVQVLHTPGHTAGHLAFHFLDESVIFFADLDLVKFGPYYGDNASSIDNTIKSLQRLAKIEAEIYLVSHGKEGILDGDPAHIQRYIDVIYQREEKLLTFLASGPKTLQEITAHGIIYGGHRLANGIWDLIDSEKSMMLKHLDRLERIGSVKKENGTYKLSGQ